MDRLTTGVRGLSAVRRRPGTWAQLPQGNLRLWLLVWWGGSVVCEVFWAAFPSKTRAAAPGQVCHSLVTDLISGSEHCAVPGSVRSREQSCTRGLRLLSPDAGAPDNPWMSPLLGVSLSDP